MDMVNHNGSEKYEVIEQINRYEEYGNPNEAIYVYGAVSTIGLFLIALIAWVLKTEKSFNKRVDDRINSKIELHTLKKAPLYKDVEYLKQQHIDLMERIVKSSEDFSKGVNKIASKMESISKDLTEVKVKIAKIEATIEAK